jgi:hypothetical protein
MELQPVTGPLSVPWIIDEWMWSIGGMIIIWENQSVWEETTLSQCHFVHHTFCMTALEHWGI